MFRNQYDNDVTVWSPQGRIHQIEYAMEAVKQGSATIGLKSKTHAILVALKRAPSELSAYQKKILPIDDHVGAAIAGLTADARLLSNFMRSECLNSRYAYDQALPISRLVTAIGNKSQILTQRYGRRPFGVGLLIAGYDSQGPHIYQTCPSANYYDCKAMAIGARSQSARTYVEKHLDKFLDCSLEELIAHGLRALRDTLPSEINLTTKNCSLGVVGKDIDFTIYDDEKVEQYLALIEGEERSSRAPPPGEGGPEGEQEPMQQEGEGGPEQPRPDGPENCSLGVVGKDIDFTIYDDEKVEQYLALIEGEERSSRAPPPGEGGPEGEQEPMQQEGEGGPEQPRPDGPEVQQPEAMDQ